MDSQTWTTTITVKLGHDDLRDMREWLAEYGDPVPGHDSDVLGKFLSVTLNSNAGWDSECVDWVIKRPVPCSQLEKDGLEREPLANDDNPYPRTSPFKRLAIDSFGLLVVLAVAVTVFAGLCGNSLHPTHACGTIRHARDIAASWF